MGTEPGMSHEQFLWTARQWPSVSELACDLEVSRQMIYWVLWGKAHCTKTMASKLRAIVAWRYGVDLDAAYAERKLDTPPIHWQNRSPHRP